MTDAAVSRTLYHYIRLLSKERSEVAIKVYYILFGGVIPYYHVTLGR